MPVATSTSLHAWWNDLRHGGLLISPALLEENFPEGPLEPSFFAYSRLRDRYTTFAAWLEKQQATSRGDAEPLHNWLDCVLEEFLGHEKCWHKGPNVPASFSLSNVLGERLRPNRVFYLDKEKTRPGFVVWVDRSKRVGIGKGRTTHSKLLEFLRAAGLKLGLLTNGSKFRLCYAGMDHDAWAEWDAESWFEEGELRRQLAGFSLLLGASGCEPRHGTEFPLLASVEASRSRQGELSTVLGEQVRQAVERLLSEVDRAVRRNPGLLDMVRKTPEGREIPQKRMLEALYQAGTRIVMRLVVILYAEARGLLPRTLDSYNASYGLEGLFEHLRRAMAHEGFQALAERHAAWPRLLSLFQLIHDGSPHSALTVQSYGGLLFRRGRVESPDPVLRALALLQDSQVEVTDATVLKLLELLKIGKIKIRRGRSATWASGPVDFSDLRTEYIGIMYEGLLDYELKATDQTMVFLNLGQQPILPLEILENMPDANLRDLLSKFGKERASGPAVSEESEEAEEESEEPEAEQEPADAEDVEAAEEPYPSEEDAEVLEAVADGAEVYGQAEGEKRRERAHQWALRAVEIAGLVKKPRGKKVNLYRYEKDREAAAQRLIARVLDQGEFYLARWGGTRKGSGTFYTKPGLAVPTVHRTLEPLVYTKGDDGKKLPRKPEEILALKVCDPACGSASFLVAALNYLTEGLYQSLLYHRCIREQEEHAVITLPFGKQSKAVLNEETVPVPAQDERFERMVKARLKRHVVERCLCGVDLNLMAVELARLSLWIETMDEELPFGFLDHKIKWGNSLVGCWFDRFMDYPLCAWLREGGDKSHSRGVHYKEGEWTKEIKKTLQSQVKDELRRQITLKAGQHDLFHFPEDASPDSLHQEGLDIFEELHALPISGDGIQQREELYRHRILDNPKLNALRDAFDSWCAAWFWPADKLGTAPTPARYYRPDQLTIEGIRKLADDMKFFHWELEFPDVFVAADSGFDAVVGNPPWEIAKPNSLEFFSSLDPIYRTYGKQDALSRQEHLFRSTPESERDWLLYCAGLKGMSNWVKCSAGPYGDPKDEHAEKISLAHGKENEILHHHWRVLRSKRRGYSDSKHPFRHQGSADINTYKMFIEMSHSVLRPGGRLGMIMPSGIYTDKGATALRSLFLDHCRWEWICGFINWEQIFNIYYRFKFAVLVIEKGTKTDSVKARFGRYKVRDWEEVEKDYLELPVTAINRFSPKSRAILEPRTRRDLEILEKVYDGSVLLGDQSPEGWQIQYAREFDMTNDSELFPPRPKWEAQGYRPDAYGRWLKGNWQPLRESTQDGVRCKIAGRGLRLQPGMIPSVDALQFVRESDIDDVALPLYEGRMVGQFDFSQKGWVSGKGRTAVWREIPWTEKAYEPQFLIGQSAAREATDKDENQKFREGVKLGFMDVTSATNSRSMIACPIFDLPCGNKVPVLQDSPRDLSTILLLPAFLNAFTYDFAFRCRLGGLSANYFIVAETPLPPLEHGRSATIAGCVTRLVMSSRRFASHWMRLAKDPFFIGNGQLDSMWSGGAVSSHERLRVRCILDAIGAEVYGLSLGDLAWIVRFDSSDPKGFWRVDQDKPIELRHTTLALAAFRDLKEIGLEAFCGLPDPDGLGGCGWQIPESLNFAVSDGGIVEFDCNDGSIFRVRERLGPRFLPWQLEGRAEESWVECELHARNLLGEERFKQLMLEVSAEKGTAKTMVKEPSSTPYGQDRLFPTGYTNLFGQDVEPPSKKRR